MPTKIFVSYRRDDSSGHAGRIHDRLAQEFGRDRLFMDVDSVPLGANFRKLLNEEVAKCDVLVAVIGPGWLTAAKSNGRRRIDDADDFVRIEIQTALKRGIPVIPLLIDHAGMPERALLPEALHELCDRQALQIRHTSFHADIEKLIRSIRAMGAPAARAQKSPALPAPGAGRNEWFKDADDGPELVVVPSGSFRMGSPDDEPERDDAEQPMRTVVITKPFAISRHAITRKQFSVFAAETGFTQDGARVWKGKQWVLAAGASWAVPELKQRGDHHVVYLSWHDAKFYASWLSVRTRQTYRLPSEAEWEYAARAGSATPFWWGSTISPNQANYHSQSLYEGGGSTGDYRETTVAVDRFDPNPWGLYQVHGNVWEWCEDVWHPTLDGAPADEAAWTTGGEQDKRVVKGGSWEDFPEYLRSAYRFGAKAAMRTSLIGCRLVREL